MGQAKSVQLWMYLNVSIWCVFTEFAPDIKTHIHLISFTLTHSSFTKLYSEKCCNPVSLGVIIECDTHHIQMPNYKINKYNLIKINKRNNFLIFNAKVHAVFVLNI